MRPLRSASSASILAPRATLRGRAQVARGWGLDEASQAENGQVGLSPTGRSSLPHSPPFPQTTTHLQRSRSGKIGTS